ncbi:helix-turn-helix transcriptional regulator [Mesorhizobium sp. 113-1-2]|uniref:helix-turn-helix transcriptional regulator n=1 Tax=Mesorhizobium sp. 113-1-2 TaxID=2744515 RepID=UPI0019283C5A|nr:AlpA family phage regulatory protein [Mesorhizobium sp. 113-1-2]
MRKLKRFNDLKADKVVGNWPQLKRLVEKHNFPPGRMLGDNTRVWFEDEVDEWLESRPLAVKRAQASGGAGGEA